MFLSLGEDHKQHLLFLTHQSTQVLQDFCKLAIEYLQKGPNSKLYNAAAQKLKVESQDIKSAVEGLLNLLLESCKSKLKEEDFRENVLALGFSEEQVVLLSKLYGAKNRELTECLESTGLKLPQYHNMEWRCETQIATRYLLHQVLPLITLDFELKNSDNSEDIKHISFQTDPNNLLHLAQELEMAVQDSRSRHLRNISRISV